MPDHSILCVRDFAGDNDTVAAAIRLAGYHPLTANDSSHAMALYFVNRQLEAVVLDHRAKESVGICLAQALRTPGLHLLGVADLAPARARENLARVGWPAERIAAASLGDAVDRGTTVPDSLSTNGATCSVTSTDTRDPSQSSVTRRLPDPTG